MEFKPSELILNRDGSIFHLRLFPGQIADTIFLVGDPNRVKIVSEFFDSIEVRSSNREFIAHTGSYKGKRITVMSTGIGTDNIDIVMNELDALVNIDLEKRILKPDRKVLKIVRIGTTGGLQKTLPINSIILSRYAAGFDTVLNFYAGRNSVSDLGMEKAFKKHTGWDPILPDPYFVQSSNKLFSLFPDEMHSGITISAPGFYAPQGRSIRLNPLDMDLNDKLESFRYGGLKIMNYEMESSALYGLSRLLGHQALTLCSMLANRTSGEFTSDHKASVRNLIKFTLEHICQ